MSHGTKLHSLKIVALSFFLFSTLGHPLFFGGLESHLDPCLLVIESLFNLVRNAGSVWEKGRIPLFFLLFWTCSHCVCFPFSASLRRHLPRPSERAAAGPRKRYGMSQRSALQMTGGGQKYGGKSKNKCGWIGGRRRMGMGATPHPAHIRGIKKKTNRKTCLT